ncbi:MAG: ABC transporter transmembrane domain-containing protein, partial [Clostridia bacterium]
MIKVLARQIKQYKLPSILTVLFTIGESIAETTIPFIAAFIIDEGISKGSMNNILFYGAIMLATAGLSLFFGIMAGRMAAVAATGYSKNLRHAMFTNIQTYAFSNIDKYSTAGLVTRLTTDVTNIQNSYQMLMRITLRSPINLIYALIMSFFISAKMSMIYLVGLVFLVIVFSFIIKNSMKYFTQVFKKYDDLNMSVQENVSSIRVVKAFVREDHEKNKFNKATENLYKLFIKAEKITTLNMPALNLTVYGSIIAIAWFGANLIYSGEMSTGNITTLFAYAMTILMSLMMLSMVFVMLSMSVASGKRIVEVIEEKSDITNGENPIFKVENGEVVFENVDFAYNKNSKKPTLENINIKINEGEIIGVIGNTGSGKTSLVNLISRLYDVTKG